MSDACKSCSSAGSCSPQDKAACGEKSEAEKELEKVLSRIKHKIVVLSGKGGVGKSTVAANIAMSLARAGKKVGLLDVDVHGPSIPRLLSLKGQHPNVDDNMIEPVAYAKNLWVMSTGFLLPSDDEAVVWRGPVKIGVIRQFIQNVAWGDLDFLVVDCPPGTGDEPLTVLQLLGEESKAVVVTTPHMLAVDDVRRSITFVGLVGATVLGIVENMSGFVCPDCGKTHEIFKSGAGEKLSLETGAPFLGRIPFDPELARAGDEGFNYLTVYPESETAKSVEKIIAPILALDA
ncbi:ATPase-like, ParA/MinD [Desulfovibrio sp. X2]|uniref:Mrp/NBP35 family ATP-binding protein n=1 Tax=Desulfovibrio sp. X2 TaxID=941449 RepID=UPI000358ABB4|nr:Mrp/NBP35 family ATP-binding protein [Desulfovibrio sp. X2]EPR42458.1 ATPase-like, ParA/MinD [Desulfovibrio sp. X2]